MFYESPVLVEKVYSHKVQFFKFLKILLENIKIKINIKIATN